MDICRNQKRKHNFIAGFVSGSIIFGAVGAFAVSYTAALIYNDDENRYFAPCDSGNIYSMKDSGGHVSPATIVYRVSKEYGTAERVQQTQLPLITAAIQQRFIMMIYV